MAIGKGAALLAIGLALAPEAVNAVDLTIMAEDAAPPFSRADGTGYANDVVKAAFRASGVDVALDVVPYARCKRSAEEGKTPGCFGMSWYQGVETFVVFSDMPVFQVHADVFLNAKPALRIASPQDLKAGTVLGIVNEYEYPDDLTALQKRGVVLQAAPNDGANLKMLARGRLDAAIIMTNDLVPRTQKAVDAGVAADVAYAFRIGVENAYVGFSLKHPQGAFARRVFNDGYKHILMDGTVEAIKRQWIAKVRP